MKTNRSNNKPILPLALALVLGATTAHGALPVTITNPSFELPAVATEGGFLSSATGWTNFNSGQIGVLNPAVADFTLQAPDGINVGWVFGGVVDAGFAQVLSSTLQADATYSLSVKVGNSLTFAYDGYRVQLLAGGTVLNEDNNTLSPAADTFVTSTVNYVYNAGLHAGLVGQPLEIRLLGKGLSGGSEGETEFDDVQLTVTLGSPVAIPGGPYSVAYTGSLSLNGGASLPSDGQTLTTYEWDLSNPPDGIYDVTGDTPAAITYATLQATYGMVVGANTIRLRVTDNSSPTPKTNETTGTVNLAVGPPANDNFANAIDLTGVGVGQTGGVTTGTQSGTYSISASLEAGEPSPGATNTNSVWFKWTSPGDGEFTYGTLGSTNAGATEWDSVIGIYTGASVNALTPLGTTPKDTVLAESMTVTVTPGTTYYIQLTGYQGEGAANILLSWNYVATVYQADILSFGPGGVISPVVANAATIAWTVPFGSNLATLAPTFTLSVGATCTLDGNPAVSGATVDFNGGPKNFVVTSQGATIVNTYTVTATIGPEPTDGTWITNGDGNWSDTTKWLDGIVASGFGATADFTLDLSATRTVTLDSDITIGNIIKDDTSTNNNQLNIGGAASAATPTLTLDVTSGSPTITNADVAAGARLEINRPLAGNDGLTIAGGGLVRLLRNETSYTGATSITGFLDFGGISNANIGGGSGQNITVAAGSIVRFNALNDTFLGRLASTTDEIGVFTGSTGNSFDFSSGLAPNAFLGCFATNGAKCELGGIITPANGAYRLGYLNQSGAMGIKQESLLSGANGLIIGGNRVVLVGAHTFTGDTTIRNGGRLGLSAAGTVAVPNTNSLALQNSVLDLGAPGATGQVFLEASTTAGPITGSNPSSVGGTKSATLGGLKGSRNLQSAFVVGNTGNNTAGTALANITGFTLNVGSGNTPVYSGNIVDFAAGTTITKTGLGTQTLSGANTYTGATSVNEGTLALVGGSHASAITVATGASLGFTLGSPTTSTKSVDLTNGTVKITGAVNNVDDYKLMTATLGFTFTNLITQLHAPITDYQLQLQNSGTELWLVYTAGGSPYATWSGGAAPNIDTNGDGVDNGAAWALNAPDPNFNAIGLLPTLDNTTDPIYVIFSFNRSDTAQADANTAISVEYSTDLLNWTTAVDNDDVDIIVTPGSPTDAVVVKLKRSTLAVGGKIFARLRVIVTP